MKSGDLGNNMNVLLTIHDIQVKLDASYILLWLSIFEKHVLMASTTAKKAKNGARRNNNYIYESYYGYHVN